MQSKKKKVCFLNLLQNTSHLFFINRGLLKAKASFWDLSSLKPDCLVRKLSLELRLLKNAVFFLLLLMLQELTQRLLDFLLWLCLTGLALFDFAQES